MLVVVGHLWGFWFAASHAVFSFYVLSGFLMTLVLNEKYGFSGVGFGEFWVARLTRLLPTYWLGCIFSIVLILLLSVEVTSAFNDKLIYPDTPYALFSNATMAGLYQPTNVVDFIPSRLPTLVPPAWALSIELFFYLCLSVYFGKSLRRSIVLLALGILYVCSVLAINPNFYWMYFFFPAGAIPFAVGAVLYFLVQNARFRAFFQSKAILATVLVLYVGLFGLAGILPGNARVAILYLNIGTSSLLIACLFTLQTGSTVRKVDAFLGDLSFPVYIFQWQVGLIMAFVLRLEKGTLALFLVSAPVLFALSVLDRAWVSGPIQGLRHKSA